MKLTISLPKKNQKLPRPPKRKGVARELQRRKSEGRAKEKRRRNQSPNQLQKLRLNLHLLNPKHLLQSHQRQKNQRRTRTASLSVRTESLTTLRMV